jgi:hypothetical protein
LLRTLSDLFCLVVPETKLLLMPFLRNSKYTLACNASDGNLTAHRNGKELGATFSGAFSIFGFLYAAADVYNGVSCTSYEYAAPS